LKHFSEDDSWLIWQIADSAFPSGGFAHSAGLEAAWQHGEVRDVQELSSFIETSLSQCAFGMAPLLRAAHASPSRLVELDELCDAFLSNHVANRASRLQGRAFLSSASRIFGAAHFPENYSGCFHFAPVFGVVARALNFSYNVAAELFLFQNLRGLIGASVRLGIAGPMEAQALQTRLAGSAKEILSLTITRGIEDIASVAPLLEIWQSSQDRLYSRLFQT
jgi:urease accessory protein